MDLFWFRFHPDGFLLVSGRFELIQTGLFCFRAGPDGPLLVSAGQQWFWLGQDGEQA